LAQELSGKVLSDANHRVPEEILSLHGIDQAYWIGYVN
jgi:hypothetical protein